MSEHVIWETSGGSYVRIVCTNKLGDRPIIGYFLPRGDVFDWKADGTFLNIGGSGCDLIIPEGTVIGGGE